MKRRTFVRNSLVAASAATVINSTAESGLKLLAAPKIGSEDFVANGFTFARLRYASGNWDADPKMPSNLLNSLIEYTSIQVNPNEHIIDIASDRLFDYPFVYLTGNKLVRFSEIERSNLRRYLRNGGFMFVDDCNHDVDGTFAKTVESEIKQILDRPDEALTKLSKHHAIYSSFFKFPDGPPSTSHELNGWGDDIVHDYLRAVEINGRVAVLYSNKDYGCEWSYDWPNKRFVNKDNTQFGVNIIVYALTH
jgi:hypothetical protein